jgi:hypothetical protein
MNQGPRCVRLMKKAELEISCYCPFKEDLSIGTNVDPVHFREKLLLNNQAKIS